MIEMTLTKGNGARQVSAADENDITNTGRIRSNGKDNERSRKLRKLFLNLG